MHTASNSKTYFGSDIIQNSMKWESYELISKRISNRTESVTERKSIVSVPLYSETCEPHSENFLIIFCVFICKKVRSNQTS